MAHSLDGAAPLSTGKIKLDVRVADGWIKGQVGDFLLYIYFPPDGRPRAGSHSHVDLGSFVFFFRGRPIIADVGRFSYADDTWGTFGYSAQAHNSIVINGFGLLPEQRSYYTDSYKRSTQYHAEAESAADHGTITIRGRCRRLGQSLSFSRVFMVTEDELSILDSLDGQLPPLDLETRFNFTVPIETQSDQKMTTIKMSDPCLEMHLEGDFDQIRVDRGKDDSPVGWMFPAYGVKVPVATLAIEQRRELPVANSYRLRRCR